MLMMLLLGDGEDDGLTGDGVIVELCVVVSLLGHDGVKGLISASGYTSISSVTPRSF